MSLGAQNVRVAAVQAAPVWFDIDGTVDKAVSLILEAASNGASIVAFPETWIPGYPAHIFGSAGWDDAEVKHVHRELMQNAWTVGGRHNRILCDVAREQEVMLVVGVNERDEKHSKGTLYNSIVYISERGELLGVHRKLMPTHAERIIYGFGDGSDLKAFDTQFGTVGGLICWEHFMPLTRFAMHSLSEQIHVAVWPEVPELHHIASRNYAFEGRCFVICVGNFLTWDDIPDSFRRKSAFADAGDFGGGSRVILPGGSGIIGPDGNWIAGPVAGEEAIVYADLDLDRIEEESMALDAVGHYNRPDVFQFSVDARRKEPVTWLGSEVGGVRQPVAEVTDAPVANARAVLHPALKT